MSKEPVGLIAAIAVVVVAILAVFGIGLETSTVETLITEGIIVIGAVIARAHVTPVPPAERGLTRRR